MAQRAGFVDTEPVSRSTPRNKAPRKLAELLASHEGQVHFLAKFLAQRGQSAAEEFRNRLNKGQPVRARGYHFSGEVINEALRGWEKQNLLKRRSPAVPSSWQHCEVFSRAPPTRPAEQFVAPPERQAAAPTAPTAPAGLRGFMDSSRRRTLGGETDENDKGSLTRTWIEMAQSRRSSTSGEPGESCSSPSRGLSTPEKAQTMKLEARRSESKQPQSRRSSSPPRKRRAVERADVGRPPSMSEPYPEPSPGREAEQAEVPESVKELKALLGRYGLDFSRCVEKVDLKELWQCFSRLRRQPLAVLQAEVARFMAAPGDADSCARLLAEVQMQLQNSTSCPVPTPAAPAPQAKVPAASAPARPSVPQVNSREREAQEEVIRILPMRRETFRSATDWAFAVLRATRDPSAVQRSYRSLMRKLHPDKVANTDGVERTITLIREAKDLCEKSFSRVVAPAPPRGLRYEVVESEVGRRRYRLRWLPPEGTASAPVCRYLVAALDPAYGKALTITILEPDYSEELKRFVSVDELTSFVLAEEDLQKMPSLWKQPTATVQVAAANEAGQSSWTKLEIWIAGTRSPASTPSSPSTSTSSESEASSPSQCSHGSFDSEIQRRSGRELQEWLQGQLKVSLMSWLKTLHLPTKGTKQELIERILDVMGVANRELPRRHDH